MIKVILVDDHQLFLQGLQSLLKFVPHINILATARNGHEALVQIEREAPHVLLTDIEMPEMDGIELTTEVKKKYPDIKILALTMYRESGMIQAILRAGADGYILKNANKEEVLKALQVLHEQGNSYYSPELAQNLLHSLANPKSKHSNPLSKREIEILQFIAQELTTAEIAEKIHLSPLTVEKHRKNILLKAGVRNTAGLIRQAMKKGWIE
ncbi:MAG: response regulator transcription factor [Bacteroidota bacterium]